MNRTIIFLAAGCILLAMQSLHARDHVRPWPHQDRQFRDTLRQEQDTAAQFRGILLPDTARQAGDSSIHIQDSTIRVSDSAVKQMSDTAGRVKDSTSRAVDTSNKVNETSTILPDSTAKTPDMTAKAQDTTSKTGDAPVKTQDAPVKTQDAPAIAADNTLPGKDSAKQAQDTTAQEGAGGKRELDTRWFISPLLKTQFQDFGMLEQNRKGYLSNANTLPFFSRGNGSFAASAYKNLTSRLSISADLGLSFGHVTDDNVLISQTKSKTYNLLNAAIYYHLLGPTYRLQPYVTIGINDLINDASYTSAPIGIGAKFNAKKIMILGQMSYGYALSKNIANTTMYAIGIYLPIKNNKKKKQAEADDTSPYNRPGKDDAKKNAKDTTAKNGQIINNIYITINMDSVLKARGYSNDDDSGNHRRKKGSGGGGSDNGDDDDAAGRKAFKDFDLDDFAANDFKIDHIDGHPVIRFVVYFEFNEYSLTSKAFNSIDKVIDHLRHTTTMYIEIKGYTDNVGTEQYNNFLSRRRANMVRDYINSRGISTQLMKAKAYGSDNPVADNSDPNSAWLNRRAEIVVRLNMDRADGANSK